MEDLLRRALRAGADECEIVCVKRRVTTVRMTDSKVAEVKENVHRSYGLRLINQKRIAASVTSDEKRLPQLIDKTMRMSCALKPRPFWQGLAHPVSNMGRHHDACDKKIVDVTCARAEDVAAAMLDAADDNKVDTITGSLNMVFEEFELYNTNSLHYKDRATYIAGFVNAESSTGSIPVSGMGHSSARSLARFEPERAGNDARSMCTQSINPKTVVDSLGGRYTIIFEPYSVGELLAFVVAPNFDLKYVHDGRSCISSCRGEQIADESLSLYDDPYAPDGMGSHPVDAEGVPTSKRSLVRRGIFEDTYSNLFDYYRVTGDAEDKKSGPSGNSARMAVPVGRSADPVPVSAPHNLVVKPGSMSREDLIKDTQNGLLVGRLWYTYAVNPTRGDFSCTARSGVALIRNGEIVCSVKPVRIVHRLPTLLMDISGIGDDARSVVQWASLPSVTPSIRVDGIWVSGHI